MSISRYMVVMVLAAMALGAMAYGQYGPQQGPAAGPGDRTPAIAGAINPQGIGTHAMLAMSPTPTRATRAQCLQSCASSFPNKTSLGYKACANGCMKVAA